MGSEMLQSPEAAIKAVDWIKDRGDAAPNATYRFVLVSPAEEFPEYRLAQ